MGGITTLPPDALFPPDADVDVSVLITGGPNAGHDTVDQLHEGLVIEAGFRSVEDYSSPEKVLSNPELAGHLAVDSVLADPTGLLASTHAVVARDFAEHRWLVSRCDNERQRIKMCADALGAATTPPEVFLNLTLLVQNITALLAVALLQPPTHRKCIVKFREQLHALGRSELAEEALSVYGCGDITGEAVSQYLLRAGEAFDRAVDVKRTPAPFDFKVQSFLRPYSIDSMQDLIDAGNHREAMGWIASMIFIAVGVLMNDAPAAERDTYQMLLVDVMEELGLIDPALWPERRRRADALAEAVSQLADDVTAVSA